MNELKSRIMGIAWYQPDQWERLLDISEDASDLEDTYEEWQSFATKKIKKLKQQGFSVQKVTIDTEELLAWCNAYRIPVNSHSRSEFVTKKLRGLSRDTK